MQPPAYTILVAAGFPDARWLLDAAAESRQGRYRTLHGETLESTLEILARERVDSLVLHMPSIQLTNPEYVQRVREVAVRVPVVVVARPGDEALARQCLEAGAIDYVIEGRFDARSLRRALRYSIEHAHGEAALQESVELLRAVVEASPLPIVALDLDENVTMWTPAAERTFGWTAGEVLGGPMPGATRPGRGETALVRRTLQGRSGTFELTRRRKDGSLLEASVSTAPLRNASGEVCGAITISADITERKGAEKERARLLEEISRLEAQREVDRRTRELARLVSHEFRTPLTAMLGFSELLLNRPVSEQDHRRWLELIHLETQRLSELVDNMLNAARLNEGRITPDVQPFELKPLVDRTLTTFAGASDRHHLENRCGDQLEVLADPDRLAQVLSNLVSNAIKYSPDGGPVVVSAEREDDHVHLQVADSGLGIPADEIPRLFERFYRIEDAERRQIRGTGLGLFITKSLTEAQGGRIWVESPGRGGGSTFHVELPAAGRVHPRVVPLRRPPAPSSK